MEILLCSYDTFFKREGYSYLYCSKWEGLFIFVLFKVGRVIRICIVQSGKGLQLYNLHVGSYRMNLSRYGIMLSVFYIKKISMIN